MLNTTKQQAGIGFVSLVRNPLAAPNRRVNIPKVEPDRTKYRRKKKHKNKGEE